uniref:U6 snRNA-associated Sm-like protein LSm2 n=1 Tax=Chromera velia CCMP2878 TaxID=1169474 RepID=A0A0G4F6N8_9ALVE|mmetsp:Transcript_34872/g.68848  ORF Transcript_34872/g.68848 Transcript_34872/m.68848 type:complete len:102 (+) Transcript_34872:353-658(+)|eukprot:Cvel_15476.t1-p1 / transcript=Cvel_15476.t1 / gene=Cvel_15476 / organism=Chromera_velia_CCMP2878 / gene_product=U6 snRNA-associated Sm-like protein LSm2, putative / transcript_product=U6 snRNA-associated Sm-like protein LSm2, putative / location=Cvel_scaffold1147:50384-52234(+) / protein_length=101 / sequence_SO=supercontig / SO=protein_coding / is_pseudo=false
MLFFSFFQTLVERSAYVTVELKNDLLLSGTLMSVDQFLNIKLNNVQVNDPEKYPHLLSVKNCFIRGSVVRYLHLPSSEVDTDVLQQSCRKELKQASAEKKK